MSRRIKDYENILIVSRNKKRRMVLYVIIALIPILFLSFSILKWPIYNLILNEYGLRTKAEIINEKNILGKGVITEMYTYSYEFNINGKTYKGDSGDRKYKVGNNLEIEYFEIYPEINRVLKTNN